MTSWDEATPADQRDDLARLARRDGWAAALSLAGWLHLAAFSLCYYLTVAVDYHGAAGYLAVWAAELLGVALVVRLRPGTRPAWTPLARLVTRVWVAYLVLVANLCSMNTLRGFDRLELFPAAASLASFGLLVLTFTVSRRFFAAVPLMFAAGLLMAAFPPHAYLVFAVAWWAVLVGTGSALRAGEEDAVAVPVLQNGRLTLDRDHRLARPTERP